MKRHTIVILLFCMSIIVDGQSDLGGTKAPNGKYPYQAALRKRSKFLCGASVINHRWLLTAAHCVKLIKVPQNASVLVGTNRLDGNEGHVYKVSKFVMHHDYDKTYVHANDIALIRTTQEMKFGKKVKPVRLPDNDYDNYDNVLVILAGWGSLQKNGRAAKDLQHVKLQVISRDRCAKEWRQKRNRTIIKSQICTVGKLDENMATHGDSGGPLVYDGVQIGVGSFAWNHLPDVFSRVDKYLPWIHRHIVY